MLFKVATKQDTTKLKVGFGLISLLGVFSYDAGFLVSESGSVALGKEVKDIHGTWFCVNNPNPVCKNPQGAYQKSKGKLEKGNSLCINNPNPVCDNAVGVYSSSGRKLEPGSWTCINNPNPVCKNPPGAYQRFMEEDK